MLRAQPIPPGTHQQQATLVAKDLPHVAQFVAEARPYLSEETIVLTSVRDADCGVVDVVLVGPQATIGFVFGQSGDAIPYFVDALYEVAALDVAHGVGDVLYVAARHHASLFADDARLRLIPFCSSRILANGRRTGSTYVGRGDDGEPIVVRKRARTVAEPRRGPFQRVPSVGTAA